jgi:hypothetical protein
VQNLQKKLLSFLAIALFVQGSLPGATSAARAQNPYPAMAPLAQYLMPDQNAEIALARTAAPKSISDAAEVLVLGRNGYTTAIKGSNGFVCMVQRGWSGSTDFSDFWNPKQRAPICFNQPAAKSYGALIVLKTKWVLAGKSKAEIGRAVESALDKKEIPPLGPEAMSYMMSKQQYLNDTGRSWRPHLMFFVPGADAKSWGANLPASPVIAADDPEERMTIFMIPLSKWSDGTPASQSAQSHPH